MTNVTLTTEQAQQIEEALAEQANNWPENEEHKRQLIEGQRKWLAEQAERVTEGNGSEVSLETEAQEPVAERKAQVNELIKESARLIASISDEGDRYLTAIDTLRNAYRLGLKDAAPVSIHSESETDSSSSSMRTTVRTKDLTDDEIVSVLEYYDHEWDETTFAIARAVIAKFKEKNK